MCSCLKFQTLSLIINTKYHIAGIFHWENFSQNHDLLHYVFLWLIKFDIHEVHSKLVIK